MPVALLERAGCITGGWFSFIFYEWAPNEAPIKQFHVIIRGVKAKIFYSWQSDIRAAACRTLIEKALVNAIAALKVETIEVEPVIDRDTLDVPGAPDIGMTILNKIDIATAFVADVTLVGTTVGGKQTPNPNVLVELGYARKALGSERILLVLNTAFGKPEDLPFDLRQMSAVTYASPAAADTRTPHRSELTSKLKEKLRLILRLPHVSDEQARQRLRDEKEHLELEHLRAIRTPHITLSWEGGIRTRESESRRLRISNVGECPVCIRNPTVALTATGAEPSSVVTIWTGTVARGGHVHYDVSIKLDHLESMFREAGVEPPQSMFEAEFQAEVWMTTRSEPYGEEETVTIPFNRIERK